jgi:hypothetical protein
MNNWPEVHDLVAVTIKQVDYYGYVEHINYDVRDLYILVEFYPGCSRQFEPAEVRLVKFPEEKNA